MFAAQLPNEGRKAPLPERVSGLENVLCFCSAYALNLFQLSSECTPPKLKQLSTPRTLKKEFTANALAKNKEGIENIRIEICAFIVQPFQTQVLS